MNIILKKWIRIYFYKIIESIAFYPALIAICFLGLSWGMLEIDFSDWGKDFKSGLSWLSLKDASTARSIISTVAGAIISLTVFSFSMVMIVLNQAASQMSNRVLNSMIENRLQQIILGIYIGTIVYALFLLSTIRDNSNGINVPALSIYLLLVLTVIDIFLFIYFLDYVTKTVKYETVINRVKKHALNSLRKELKDAKIQSLAWEKLPLTKVKARKSGYFQAINEKQLLDIAHQNDLYFSFLYKPSTFILEGTFFLHIYSSNILNNDVLQQVHGTIDFFVGQPLDRNSEYGFKQIAEVAIKALSPGINDPGTAVLSLHALFEMFALKLQGNIPTIPKDQKNISRIHLPHPSFSDMFDCYILPIWNYGKNDEYIKQELVLMIEQLKTIDVDFHFGESLNRLLQTVKSTK